MISGVLTLEVLIRLKVHGNKVNNIGSSSLALQMRLPQLKERRQYS